MDILVGSSQNRTGFRGHFCAFLVLFLMSIFFFFFGGGGLLNFKYFWSMSDIQDILGG